MVSVNAALLWPARSDTSRTLQSAATRIATKLCRRPQKVRLEIPARMTAGGCRTPRELYRALNASTTLTAQTWAVRRLFDKHRRVGWSTPLPR